ncbi:pyrroline-5-carboxylate reductase, partial [Mariniblastus sp.]|nr:pyrroline-5-carboxylate reductase [Mariniblastus sp.]
TIVAVHDESLIDSVTGVSGSGPAYVYTFIEAMIDGGVLVGLKRDVARELAIQTVLGAAQLMKETGKHPGELRDQVTSPGGTTITALKALEETGMRDAVMSAVLVCTERAKEL